MAHGVTVAIDKVVPMKHQVLEGQLMSQENPCLFFPFLLFRYRGHVPSVVYSFGDTYGNTTMKYFQDFRNRAMECSHSPYSKGGQFPTLFSPDAGLVLGARAVGWDRWLHTPNYSRFNLDISRSEELNEFFKVRLSWNGSEE